jgi:hypothetical protein
VTGDPVVMSQVGLLSSEGHGTFWQIRAVFCLVKSDLSFVEIVAQNLNCDRRTLQLLKEERHNGRGKKEVMK